ncbi:hypothetical protein [Nocardia niwae]|uniref:hypothetical protein n=1 Tax=Nocardia niwae TaxID=626084 RepID=UPI0007A3DD84|nr:hypothetical protein [Nocardia niwae]
MRGRGIVSGLDLVAGAVFPLELVEWKLGAALLFVDGGLNPGASLGAAGVVTGAVLSAGGEFAGRGEGVVARGGVGGFGEQARPGDSCAPMRARSSLSWARVASWRAAAWLSASSAAAACSRSRRV